MSQEIRKQIDEIYQEIENNGLMAVMRKLGRGRHIQLPFSQTARISSVEVLDLTVKDYNWLKRAGLKTIDDIIDYINNGEKACVCKLDGKMSSRIKTKVCEYGYNCLPEKEKKKFIENLLSQNRDILIGR